VLEELRAVKLGSILLHHFRDPKLDLELESEKEIRRGPSPFPVSQVSSPRWQADP
jgi:hypothetical protein